MNCLNLTCQLWTQAKRVATCESIAAKYARDGAGAEAVLKARVRCLAEAEKLLRRPHYKQVVLEDRVYQSLLDIHGTRANDYSL